MTLSCVNRWTTKYPIFVIIPGYVTRYKNYDVTGEYNIQVKYIVQ